MILVITGTHHQPFDRLVRAAEALAATSGERVVVQAGPSREPAPHCEVEGIVSPARLLAWVQEARVVVCHAAPGSVRLALTQGKAPILVPRDPAHGEHIDAHQLAWAARVASVLQVVVDPSRLTAAVLAALPGERVPAVGEIPGLPDAQMARRLGALVDGLIAAQGRRPPGLCASLPRRFLFFGRGR